MMYCILQKVYVHYILINLFNHTLSRCCLHSFVSCRYSIYFPKIPIKCVIAKQKTSTNKFNTPPPAPSKPQQALSHEFPNCPFCLLPRLVNLTNNNNIAHKNIDNNTSR